MKANNFAGRSAKPRYSANEPKVTEEKPKVPRKPKYEGKTQDYWPKLVNDFKEEGKMFMYINLAGTVAKEINDMTVVIEFPNGMNSAAKEFLERPENKMNLKNIIHQASGKDMQIKFVDTKPDANEDFSEGFENFAKNSDVPFNII